MSLLNITVCHFTWEGVLHHPGPRAPDVVVADVELHVAGDLVTGQAQQEVLQRVNGQLAVRQVEVLKPQGHREKLLECCGNFS